MKLIDIFTSGPNLTIHGNTRTKNDIGGAISLLVLSGLLILALNSVVILFARRKLNVTTNIGSLTNEDVESISKNNSLISFRLDNTSFSHVADEDYLLSYEISQVKFNIISDKDGYFINAIESKKLEYDYCDKVKFNGTERHYVKNMTSYKCIKDLKLDFVSNQTYSTYININIRLCRNNLDLNITSGLKLD